MEIKTCEEYVINELNSAKIQLEELEATKIKYYCLLNLIADVSKDLKFEIKDGVIYSDGLYVCSKEYRPNVFNNLAELFNLNQD